MTQIISNSFKEIDIKKAQVSNLSQLFIKDGANYISVDKLEVAVKTEVIGGFVTIKESRAIRNVADLKQNLGKLCLKDSSGFYVGKFSNPTIYHKGFVVPSTYESISMDKTGASASEKIPYGLKRTLTTEAQAPSKDVNAYLYVQIGDEWTFIRQNDVYYFDGAEKKTYLDAVKEGKDISGIKFFTAEDKEISSLYTEYEYKFGKIIKKEVLDLKKRTRSIVSIDDAGKETTEKSEEVNPTYSELGFEKVEVDDETKPGKKKTVSKIKSKNYSASAVSDTNKNDPKWYVAVTVKNAFNSHTMMAKLSDVVDEDGKEIKDFTKMIGKKVKIKVGDLIVATSEPLTFEQANLRYETLKTYQEVATKPNENTCLRLTDGSYVNELDSVQPKAFKVADPAETNFDKYLVQQTREDGKKIYVVVDKDYFEKHSSARGLDPSTCKKLVACAYTDANCDVIQTTSEDDEIELCSIVRKIPGIDLEVQDKLDAYKGFKTAYAEGKYYVNSIYIDGVEHTIENGRRRYEYTDVSYHEDYAENLHQYRSMSTKDTKIVNGKMKGGAKYDVEKGMINAYKTWGKALLAGITVVPMAGLFGLVAAPIVTAYGVAVLAAGPAIPLVTAGIGLVKNGHLDRLLNRVTKFKDKTEYNRKHQVSDITKRISVLFEIQNDLNPKQFEDEYSRIMNDILMLSATTSNNVFVVEDGVAKVNSNNANIANEYIKKFNANKKKLDACSKKLNKLKAKGKAVPVKLQEQYDELVGEKEKLMNTKVGNSYAVNSNMEQLKTNVAALKFYYYVSHLKGAELDKFLNQVGLTDSFSETRITYDIKHGLKLDNVSIYASDKQLKKAFNNDGATIEAWKNVKDMLIASFDKVEATVKNPPINAGVDDLLQNQNTLETLYKELSNEISFTIEISDDYAIKESLIKNQLKIKNSIDSIYTSARSLTSVEVIGKKIVELNTKKEWISNLKNKAEKVEKAVVSVEELIIDYESVLDQIKEQFEKIPVDVKAKFEGEYKSLEKIVKKSNQIIKSTKNVDKIQEQEGVLQDNLKKANKLTKFIGEIELKTEKGIIVEKILEYYNLSTERIESLKSTKVEAGISGLMMILNANKENIKSCADQAKLKATTRDEAFELRNRALMIYRLIDIGVKSLLLLEELIKQDEQYVTHSRIGKIIIRLAEIIQVVPSDTIDTLRLKLAKAQSIYEHDILAFRLDGTTKPTGPQPEPNPAPGPNPEDPGGKPVKPKTPRVNKNAIISENSLVQQLEDRDSSMYEHIFHLIKGTYKLSNDDAIAEIEKFVDKVNEAHSSKLSVTKFIEDDKIAKFILKKGLMEMNNLITINY